MSAYDDDEYYDDEDCYDEDYIICSVCGSPVLRSSDPRARENGCCLDCYYDFILEPEEESD